MELPATFLTHEARSAVCRRLFDGMTTIMDEEAALEGRPERKLLLADCGDFRAPIGLALVYLDGYNRTGAPRLREDGLAMANKSAAALSRLSAARPDLTATQRPLFDAVASEAAPLLDAMRLALAEPVTGPARPSPAADASAALTAQVFAALSTILDLERELPCTPERKQVVARTVGARGPLGHAIGYLHEYLTSGEPSAFRRFSQVCARIETELSALEGLADIFSTRQACAFAEVQRHWAQLDETFSATVRARTDRWRKQLRFGDLARPAATLGWPPLPFRHRSSP